MVHGNRVRRSLPFRMFYTLKKFRLKDMAKLPSLIFFSFMMLSDLPFFELRILSITGSLPRSFEPPKLLLFLTKIKQRNWAAHKLRSSLRVKCRVGEHLHSSVAFLLVAVLTRFLPLVLSLLSPPGTCSPCSVCISLLFLRVLASALYVFQCHVFFETGSFDHFFLPLKTFSVLCIF